MVLSVVADLNQSLVRAKELEWCGGVLWPAWATRRGNEREVEGCGREKREK